MYQYTCHVICDVVWVRFEKKRFVSLGPLFPYRRRVRPVRAAGVVLERNKGNNIGGKQYI
jgi:hypothetical protein